MIDSTTTYALQRTDKQPRPRTACMPIWHADTLDVIHMRDIGNLVTYGLDTTRPTCMVPDLL